MPHKLGPVLKTKFFSAAPKRSKLLLNDLYIYLRLFAKSGAKLPNQKKVIKVQSVVFVTFAVEIGPSSFCRPKNT